MVEILQERLLRATHLHSFSQNLMADRDTTAERQDTLCRSPHTCTPKALPWPRQALAPLLWLGPPLPTPLTAPSCPSYQLLFCLSHPTEISLSTRVCLELQLLSLLSSQVVSAQRDRGAQVPGTGVPKPCSSSRDEPGSAWLSCSSSCWLCWESEENSGRCCWEFLKQWAGAWEREMLQDISFQ